MNQTQLAMRRRWLSIRLRDWLLLALLLCVCVGWWKDRARLLEQKSGSDAQVRQAMEAAAISETARRMHVAPDGFAVSGHFHQGEWWVVVWPQQDRAGPHGGVIFSSDGSVRQYFPPEGAPSNLLPDKATHSTSSVFSSEEDDPFEPDEAVVFEEDVEETEVPGNRVDENTKPANANLSPEQQLEEQRRAERARLQFEKTLKVGDWDRPSSVDGSGFW